MGEKIKAKKIRNEKTSVTSETTEKLDVTKPLESVLDEPKEKIKPKPVQEDEAVINLTTEEIDITEPLDSKTDVSKVKAKKLSEESTKAGLMLETSEEIDAAKPLDSKM